MRRIKEFYRNLPPMIRNKYVLTGLVFVVWMVFFDSNNLILQMERRSTINDLEEQKTYYQEQIVQNKQALHDLLSSPENLEKFARENHKMKRDNEEIFFIVKE
jgi:cell division protein FtsB